MRCTSATIAVVFFLGCGGGGSTDGGAPDAPADAAQLPAPEVVTSDGPVVGNRGAGFQEFLGIPYAAPPVGALRWRPPQPPEPWTAPRAATSRPPRCAQTGLGGFALPSQEDCLYLNVHAPDPRPAAAPVMVWIHGGAFVFGEGTQADNGTRGDLLAARSGVVVVSMNYRLGAFGFLAHPALSAEAGASGNYGLADQRAALEWVRANIAAFGGDPENITIFGESAGGMSVCAHLVSPGSAGLFHRAITQSGLCDSALETLAGAELDGAALASRLGCETPADEAACMRAASVEAVHDADESGSFATLGRRRRAWWPIVDGEILPGDFRTQLAAGGLHRVPTLVGWNADEGTLFVMLAEQGGALADEAGYDEALRQLAEHAGVSLDAVRAQYPLADYPDPGAAIADAMGHVNLACPSRRAARLLAAQGADVRVYHFTYPDAAFQLSTTRDLGAFHSAEIQYVFGHPATIGRPSFRGADATLNDAAAGYWTRFAATGDPNGEGAALWPAYDEASDAHLVLDREIVAGSGADAADCVLWEP